MVADEQGARHGSRGNGEVLKDEGHDEEAEGKSAAERGKSLKGSFVRLHGDWISLFHLLLHRDSLMT